MNIRRMTNLVLLFSLAAVSAASVAHASTGPTLNVVAYIDGRSRLVLQGDTVYWHHLDYAAPGRHFEAPGGNVATFLNGTEWCPSWPGDPPDLEPCAPVDNESRDCDCDSSSFVGVPALAAQPQTVALEAVTARHSVAVVQQPSASNGFTLIVEFDDNPPGGADWYKINLTYAAVTPLPVALDIKPRSCPNPINVKQQGVLPVAILGTDSLDVTQIDPATVRLEGVAPLRWALEDVATPYAPFTGKKDAYACTQGGPDGTRDLTLKFAAQEVIAALGGVNDGETLVLHLTGNLKAASGGMPIAGEDVVRMLKKGK